MKSPILLTLLSITHHAASSRTPLLQYDPATASDCVEWHNNILDEPESYIGDSSCEAVRDYFNITPQEFHKWNPSVGLDCKPWYDATSYCIVTLERLRDSGFLTSSSTPSSPTTATSPSSTTTTLGPSPTSWIYKGCYAESSDPRLPVLEENMSSTGPVPLGQVATDPDLTIAKCLDTCYRAAYRFAGMQEGNQCWCSSFVGGESTQEQNDCDVPCSGGDATGKEKCGGRGVIGVFEALENEEEVVPTTTAGGVGGSGSGGGSGGSSGSSGSSTTTTAAAAAASSTTNTSGAALGAAMSSGVMKGMALVGVVVLMRWI